MATRLVCRSLAVLFIFFAIGLARQNPDAVDTAVDQIGDSYVWGDEGPDTFDCSGLTQYVYAQVGVTLPRTSLGQSTTGTLVVGDLQRGDLLFFATDDERPGMVTHVGIYEGNNIMIDANSYYMEVVHDDISLSYWADRYLFARRLNPLPIGFFDEISSDGIITGWSYDPDQPGTPNTIQIFFDGPAGAGTLIHSGPTTVLRSDVNSAYNITGNHGFEFPIPASYRDGQSHGVYIYGLDLDDPTKSILLTGSPKNFTLPGVPAFTPISNPTAAYINSTNLLPISVPDFTIITFVSNATQTVSFSPPMEALTVPASWATWNSPPYTESNTPRVLWSTGSFSVTITLSNPVSIFGFETEPNPFAVHTIAATFMNGTTVIGTVSREINGHAGALLAAASSGLPITSVRIVSDADFAIAQIRAGSK